LIDRYSLKYNRQQLNWYNYWLRKKRM